MTHRKRGAALKKRILTLLLSAALLLTLAIPAAADATGTGYENTWVNTGNQIEDLIGVAMTQLGYQEGFGDNYENDTKYGEWYGFPYQAWCAMFISWCAAQADIPTSVMAKSAWASPKAERGFNIPWHSGEDYIPQRGDLFFKPDFSHTGIVYGVEGEYVLTIEGNTNNDGGEDGFWVLLSKRRIDGLLFGTPRYNTCTQGNAMTRGHDEAHPHANYNQCTVCGAKFYTGSHYHRTDCKSCMSCGCSTAQEGWYDVVTNGGRLKVRSAHSSSSGIRGVLEPGERIYVLAAGNSWAHILFADSAGYVPTNQLKKYIAPPNLTADGSHLYRGDSITFQWNAVDYADRYELTVQRDGEEIAAITANGGGSHTLTDLQPGSYTAAVRASDGVHASAPGICSFTVLDRFTITYDAGDGSNAPEQQTKYEDQPLTLSATVPVREDFRFLGWNDDPIANYPLYQPGDSWNTNENTTLYAVWQTMDALPEALVIRTPARKQLYLVGDALDLTGLVLEYRYSDGTARIITEGYTAEGFSSAQAGTVEVILRFEGLSLIWPLEILDYIPGDIDGNREVNKEDVMQLLWHISFPDMFPIDVPADFTGDGKTDKEDVMQLLWHVSFPDMFPLMGGEASAENGNARSSERSTT